MFSQARSTPITEGTFNTIHPGGSSSLSAFERLEKATAHAGFHDSIERPDPPRCHPRTRLAIQDQIKAWIHRKEDPKINVMWLTGGAGGGKSAIAQCIAEQCEEEGRLAAGFFFGRTDPARNDGRKLVATIAYQICLHIPGVQEPIEAAITRDPLIFNRSLASQMKALVVDPLRQLQINGNLDPKSIYVVIVDGLDECHSHDTQCSILTTIADAVSQANLPLRFLVASRPESHITTTFLSRKLAKLHTRRTLDDSLSPDQDIEIFLRDSFDEIKETHALKSYIPSNWPSDEEISFLVQKASGQFIYASVVIKYVKSPRRRPKDCLDNILGLRPILHDAPFAELDSLYHHILADVEDIDMVLRILSVLTSLSHLNILWIRSTAEIELFLGFSPGDVRLYLADLTSIITIGSDVRISHASLGDFLQDKRRSTHLFVDLPMRYEALARRCLYHLSNKELMSSDDHPAAIQWARSTIFVHSQHTVELLSAMSALTPELRIDICEFSIFNVYAASKHYHTPEGIGFLFESFSIWRFIKSIEALNLQDGKAIINRHLNDMRSLIIQTIGRCYSDIGFTSAISVLNLVQPYPHGASLRLSVLLSQLGDPNQSPMKFYDEHKVDNIFGLLTLPRSFHPRYDAYTSWVRECIKEREEKAMHPLDHGKYTTASISVLRFLCSEFIQKFNSQFLPRYSHHDRNIRRNKPRQWRQKRFGIHGTLLSARLDHCRTLWFSFLLNDLTFNEKLRKTAVNTNVIGAVIGTKWVEDRESYSIMVRAIPRLLDRSDYNAELITLAKTISFPYQILSFRKEKAALVAIRKYLRHHLPIREHDIL